MQRIRILPIVGVVVFGLASIGLTLVGLWTGLMDSGMGCPGCSDTEAESGRSTLYLVGGGLCAVATVVCGIVIRRR